MINVNCEALAQRRVNNIFLKYLEVKVTILKGIYYFPFRIINTFTVDIKISEILKT